MYPQVLGEIQIWTSHFHLNSSGCSFSRRRERSFHTTEDGEEMLGPHLPYLGVIGPNTSGQEQGYLSISPVHQIS